jgi:hypothetical protein
MIQILTAFRCELLTIAIVYESLKDAFGGPPALNSKVLRCASTCRRQAWRRAAPTILLRIENRKRSRDRALDDRDQIEATPIFGTDTASGQLLRFWLRCRTSHGRMT